MEPEIWAGAGLSFETYIDSYYMPDTIIRLSNLHENSMEEIKIPYSTEEETEAQRAQTCQGQAAGKRQRWGTRLELRLCPYGFSLGGPTSAMASQPP